MRVVDEHTVAFPNFDGNGTYLSMGNVLVNPAVGMFFTIKTNRTTAPLRFATHPA